MNVNLKGAASNAFCGIREICNIIESTNEKINESHVFLQVEIADIFEQLEATILNYQPQAAAFSLKSILDGNADEAIRIVSAIEALRENEGDSVEILSDNADYPGANCAVLTRGDFSEIGNRFEGDTLLEALESAVKCHMRLK